MVFLSPPWGGPAYADAAVFDIVTMMGGLDGAKPNCRRTTVEGFGRLSLRSPIGCCAALVQHKFNWCGALECTHCGDDMHAARGACKSSTRRGPSRPMLSTSCHATAIQSRHRYWSTQHPCGTRGSPSCRLLSDYSAAQSHWARAYASAGEHVRCADCRAGRAWMRSGAQLP